MRAATHTILLAPAAIVLASFVNAEPVTSDITLNEPTVQTTCPVMEGNPINKDLHVDYKGRRNR